MGNYGRVEIYFLTKDEHIRNEIKHKFLEASDKTEKTTDSFYYVSYSLKYPVIEQIADICKYPGVSMFVSISYEPDGQYEFIVYNSDFSVVYEDNRGNDYRSMIIDLLNSCIDTSFKNAFREMFVENILNQEEFWEK